MVFLYIQDINQNETHIPLEQQESHFYRTQASCLRIFGKYTFVLSSSGMRTVESIISIQPANLLKLPLESQLLQLL